MTSTSQLCGDGAKERARIAHLGSLTDDGNPSDDLERSCCCFESDAGVLLSSIEASLDDFGGNNAARKARFEPLDGLRGVFYGTEERHRLHGREELESSLSSGHGGGRSIGSDENVHNRTS